MTRQQAAPRHTNDDENGGGPTDGWRVPTCSRMSHSEGEKTWLKSFVCSTTTP